MPCLRILPQPASQEATTFLSARRLSFRRLAGPGLGTHVFQHQGHGGQRPGPRRVAPMLLTGREGKERGRHPAAERLSGNDS